MSEPEAPPPEAPPKEAPADAPPPEHEAPPPEAPEETPVPAEEVSAYEEDEGQGEAPLEEKRDDIAPPQEAYEEEHAGEEQKAVEKIEDEPDSSLSIDDKGGSAMETKEQAIEAKKMKALGSAISVRKGNQEMLDRSKAPKYMNSYKLESDKPFNSEKVEGILKEVLTDLITDDLAYDADKIMKTAKFASGVIRDKVKEQEFDRYKIICVVTIGEKKSQDVYSIIRFLWDANRDKFARYVHENMRLFAVALCFGLYYE